MREGGQEEGRAKRRDDDEEGWPETLGGADDSGASLERVSQQPWGLMMEVIGIHLCKGGRLVINTT